VNRFHFVALGSALFLCAGASAGAPRVKALDPSVVEATRLSLQGDLAGAGQGLSSWFGTVAICAPQLWGRINASLDRRGIEVIPGKFGNADGAVFKGAPGNQRLAGMIEPMIRGAAVRALTNEEIGRYWAIFPFEEIEEPFFMASSKDADLLVHLIWDQERKHYTVFLIEAFRLPPPEWKPDQPSHPAPSPVASPASEKGAPPVAAAR